MNLAAVKEDLVKDAARVFFAVISLILVSLLTTTPDRGSHTRSQFTKVTDNATLVTADTTAKKLDSKKKKLRRPSSI